MARRYYEKAAKGDFDAAKIMLAAITFDQALFISPLLPAIYQGMVGLHESVDMRRQDAPLGYVYGFVSSLRSDCRSATRPANTLVLLKLRARNEFAQATIANPNVEVMAAAGDIDAQAFVQRHGCDGPVAKRAFDNLNAYIALHNDN